MLLVITGWKELIMLKREVKMLPHGFTHMWSMNKSYTRLKTIVFSEGKEEEVGRSGERKEKALSGSQLALALGVESGENFTHKEM